MSFRSLPPRSIWTRLLAGFLSVILATGAGCQPMLDALPLDEIAGQATGTPTPNLTRAAVARMLTETAAVPTPTSTPTVTLTRIVTATATTEVILEGSQKRPAPGGQPFVLGSMRLSVLNSQWAERVGRLKAQEGQIYLDMEVLLVNQGERPVSYTAFYLRLSGPDGRIYQPAGSALGPDLLSGTLRAGERVRGHVAFALPVAVMDSPPGSLRLVFRPELDDLPAGSGLREAWIALDAPPPAGTATAIPPTPEIQAGWPGEALPGPGQAVEAAGIRLAVTDVAVRERVEFGKAPAGSQFVVLAVQIRNLDRTRLPYNPLYFRVKDAAGYEYLPTAGSPETSLQAGTLYPGQSVSGQLIFQVPLSANRLVLSLLPTVLWEEFEEIRIEIDVTSP